ncbi:MAG: hypothetical protein AB7K36_04165 [Chloroflexota bacterium]
MSDQRNPRTPDNIVEEPLSPDAETGPAIDPLPIPGAAGPMGGSITGEEVDGVNQRVQRPGDRPPLTTD